MRIGGFVKEGNVNKKVVNKYNFIITDNKTTLNITYEGLLPDLFREGQGVVIEGKVNK